MFWLLFQDQIAMLKGKMAANAKENESRNKQLREVLFISKNLVG